MDQNSLPWIEKYRPKSLSDMAQNDNLIDLFKNSIRTGKMTHYLFYGPPGTGKTSAILAMGREIFKEHFSSRVIEFNASDDRGINAVRDKISNEAKKYVSEMVLEDGTVIPPYKIIILDEADSMTDEAQDALRVIIEQYSTVTRFCFICNYISKITDAIKSRCSPVYFKKLDHECMVQKLSQICKVENMDLPEIILDTIIDVSNGDMRKAIMLLQNLKYLYEFKNISSEALVNLPLDKLKYIPNRPNQCNEITKNDVYHLAATITPSKAKGLIGETVLCNSVKEIILLAKRTIAMGYPVDSILYQLNKAILESDWDDKKKSQIIIYSGKICLKMKECANEYIQLIDYMNCVNSVFNDKMNELF